MRREGGLFRRAIELSVLVHLLLVFVIAPQVQRIVPAAVTPVVAVPEPQDEKPLRFELVDLPAEREEAPPADRPVPLSDLDRRAHGGEGEAASTPGVRGTSPMLVQSDGGNRMQPGRPASRPGVPAPPSQSPPEPQPQPREPQPSQPDLVDGAGEPAPTPAPRLRLPAPGSWAAPSDQGGFPERPDRPGGRSTRAGSPSTPSGTTGAPTPSACWPRSGATGESPRSPCSASTEWSRSASSSSGTGA